MIDERVLVLEKLWLRKERKSGSREQGEEGGSFELTDPTLHLLLYLLRTLIKGFVQHYPQPLDCHLISQLRSQAACYREDEGFELLLVLIEETLVASSFVQSPVEGEFSKTGMTEGSIYCSL